MTAAFATTQHPENVDPARCWVPDYVADLRDRHDPEYQDELAAALLRGDPIPPARVIRRVNPENPALDLMLLAGVQRLDATVSAELPTIAVIVEPDDADDEALWLRALLDNQKNGRRYTPAEKTRAITIYTEAHPDLPNTEIASRLQVSETAVRRARKRLEPDAQPERASEVRFARATCSLLDALLDCVEDDLPNEDIACEVARQLDRRFSQPFVDLAGIVPILKRAQAIHQEYDT